MSNLWLRELDEKGVKVSLISHSRIIIHAPKFTNVMTQIIWLVISTT